MRILDPSCLARVSMEAIVEHWTAGSHKANSTDLRSYHVLTEGDGAIRYGVDIALNAGTLKNGYAAHTRAANTNRIGHSMCGMSGAREVPWTPGTAPLTLTQWNSHILAAADLCEFYKIAVARNKLLFHAEVQATLGIAQAGKWDVTRLPFDDSVRGAHAIGDRFRDEVLAALRGNAPSPLPHPEPVPAAVVGAKARVTAASLNFRRGPGTQYETISTLPSGVMLTVIAIQGDWLHARTPMGFEGWVHAGYVQMLDVAPAFRPTTPDPLHAEIARLRGRLDELAEAMPTDRSAFAAALATANESFAAF